jgi:uncharacterized damage-inducible protein DinB
MTTEKLPEYWQRGPIIGIPGLLQPVAHALLQARQEVEEVLTDFPAELLWQKPNGLASVAFHIQHITGVINRLFTYASGAMLNAHQLDYLQQEGIVSPNITKQMLLQNLHHQIQQSITVLSLTLENILTETRLVGRKQIPSTVIGLFFHAAEHTMRHTGQLLVTAEFVKAIAV